MKVGQLSLILELQLFYEFQEMCAQMLEKNVVTWELNGFIIIPIFISRSTEILLMF